MTALWHRVWQIPLQPQGANHPWFQWYCQRSDTARVPAFGGMHICQTRNFEGLIYIVCLLPYLHDLPPLNSLQLETALANDYIEELVVRHHGARAVDFNQIYRGDFSRHGMQLKPRCKMLFVKFAHAGLEKTWNDIATAISSDRCLTSKLWTHPQNITGAEPFTLRYNTFADAARDANPENVHKLVLRERENTCVYL